MKRLFLPFVVSLASLITPVYGQIDSMKFWIDSLEASFVYQHGEVAVADIGKLNVPDNFRYLEKDQARYVLEDLWGNPADETILGMIVPKDRGVLTENSWAFVISYEEIGYVDDNDADAIDYGELLDNMKAEANAANEERRSWGYEPVEIVGWASQPFYDRDRKVLHWAKEIKFGENEVNTLNYNVRILGRKGVLVLNVVASMDDLPVVNQSINPVLSSFTYADGLKYNDFDPNMDEVAAWTIGGLVAGKILAKTGILALLLKNIKLIIIAIGALGTGIWRWYRRKTSLPDVKTFGESPNDSQS